MIHSIKSWKLKTINPIQKHNKKLNRLEAYNSTKAQNRKMTQLDLAVSNRRCILISRQAMRNIVNKN